MNSTMIAEKQRKLAEPARYLYVESPLRLTVHGGFGEGDGVDRNWQRLYGDTIPTQQITAVVVQVDDQERVYVPIRPICDFLGVAWDPQRRRIMRDPVLSKHVQGVTVTVTPGGRQEMACLPLDYLNGWMRLFTRTLIAA